MSENRFKCENCTMEIDSTLKVCPVCGAEIKNWKRGKKGRKKPFFMRGWFFAIILFIIIGAGAYSEENMTYETGMQNEAAEATGDEDGSSATKRQKKALQEAESYLSFSAFSYEGLIEQLKYDKHRTKDAVYAADNCGADWNEQAVLAAENYLQYSAFSREGLNEQLLFDGFTTEQALYGADTAYASAERANTSRLTIGQKYALFSAEEYLTYSTFSYEGLIEQLRYDKYSMEDAVYAADNCGADWMEEAVKVAESYLEFSSFTREELINQLEFEGFTYEQAVYGAEAKGL